MKLATLYIFLFIILVGCGYKHNQEVTASTFRDMVKPCILVRFTDVATLDSYNKQKKMSLTISTHTFSVPANPEQILTLTKMSSSKSSAGGFTFKPISEVYSPSEIAYEIPYSTEYSQKTAGTVITQKDKGVYLTAVVEEITADNSMYRFTVDTIIQKREYLHLFSMENWKKSAIGQRFIKNMSDQADWYYKNIEQISCEQR